MNAKGHIALIRPFLGLKWEGLYNPANLFACQNSLIC